ncbi:MAG: type I DNA topoisomerase [Candidatus Roizmanbacteria bacterium]
MSLIIVESPTKARTISRILGSGYTVIASYGHIMDLPDSKRGTSIKKSKSTSKKTKVSKKLDNPDLDLRLGINTKTYEPIYVVSEKGKKIVADIKRLSALEKEVLIATDPDREGESIAAHIAEIIDAPEKIKRVTFHEITPKEIKSQIAQATTVNHNLVEAQKARRVLDRLVGYKVSPLLWRKFFMGLSAGRVQSVALKAVVEREEEIASFVPVSWFQVFAHVKEIVFEYVQKDKNLATLKTEKEAQDLISKLDSRSLIVESIVESSSSRSAPTPFTTSTLQQTASARLGYAPKRTMSLAQQLFEAGFITYHRTDSVNLSEGFVSQAAEYITQKYGPTYLEKRIYKTKSKNAQEAHEAIRPTNLDPDIASQMNPDAARLYQLIFSRTVGSQMSDAQVNKVVVMAQVVDLADISFRADFQSIGFAGFSKLYQTDIGETSQNPFKKGESFVPDKIESKQTSTKPPARYSEATLIKFLEEQGIGRPSTYASILATIVERKYVEILERRLHPTDTGIMVTKYLNEKFSEIMNYQFTADLEQKLDDISTGERKFIDVMREFDEPFEKILKVNMADTTKANTGAIVPNSKCPICGKPMMEKLGRFGKFWSCIDYPTCKGIMRINKDGRSQDVVNAELDAKSISPEFLAQYEPAPRTTDDKPYLLRKGRFGEFWAHPDYPTVKDAQPLRYTAALILKLYGPAPTANDGKTMMLRSGKYGFFWAHPDYPTVREIQKATKLA